MNAPNPSNTVRRRLLATGAVIACATAAAGLIVGPGTAQLPVDPVRSGLMAAATLTFVGPEPAQLTLAEAMRLAETSTDGFKLLYPDDMPLWDKTRTIAQSLYGAQGIIAGINAGSMSRTTRLYCGW